LRFLVSTHVPGVQVQEVLATLSEADLEPIAAELGQFMRAFHAIAAAGFERAAEIADARALHMSRGVDPGRVDQILAFLAAQAPALGALGPPVLVHADLTAEHVMLAEVGGQWRLAGVLDLADAMMAPAELDLVPPFLELFRGRRSLQRRLLAESGVAPPSGSFSELLMAVALQHRFMHFDDWFSAEVASGVTDVTEIARRVFPG
jgi:hygromycin-B 7''-O-kinase